LFERTEKHSNRLKNSTLSTSIDSPITKQPNELTKLFYNRHIVPVKGIAQLIKLWGATKQLELEANSRNKRWQKRTPFGELILDNVL